VALGPATADRLGLEVGDEVVIVGSRSNAMRVVGETVLPIMGQGAYGDVLWLTDGAVDLVGIEPDEPRLLLHLAPGRTRHDLAVAVGDGGDDVPVPDNVSNLDGVGQIPLALALFGALLSAAVVAFALVGLVRRREDDLAILRTLGLRPRQVKGLVFAASLFIVGPGAAMAVAIGAVLGRAYWSAVAAGVPVLARPVVPLELSAVVVLGALAVGLVLAVGPAWLATRIRPAEVLQRD
jgi:putative ABC transport system permease protein